MHVNWLKAHCELYCLVSLLVGTVIEASKRGSLLKFHCHVADNYKFWKAQKQAEIQKVDLGDPFLDIFAAIQKKWFEGARAPIFTSESLQNPC